MKNRKRIQRIATTLVFAMAIGLFGFVGSGAGCNEDTSAPGVYIIPDWPYDLADSGGHVDYDSNQSKYDDYVKSGVKVWNAHRAGTFRPDDLSVVGDVRITDVNKPGNGWTGATNLTLGAIQLNSAYLDDSSSYSTNNIKHTVYHELGHTLGLDENNSGASTSIMRQGKLTNITLSADDKASFDAAATRY
ncbi:MAG: cell surface protein [Oscillospiraceae bacterium]|jgi:hypothetical protein|nr:cell surface protein [Oscillospiraceae bacterium]